MNNFWIDVQATLWVNTIYGTHFSTSFLIDFKFVLHATSGQMRLTGSYGHDNWNIALQFFVVLVFLGTKVRALNCQTKDLLSVCPCIISQVASLFVCTFWQSPLLFELLMVRICLSSPFSYSQVTLWLPVSPTPTIATLVWKYSAAFPNRVWLEPLHAFIVA